MNLDSRNADTNSDSVPIEYGWCECGLLHCGRPYHGDFDHFVGPAASKCEQKAFYKSRGYNPAARENAPRCKRCVRGDKAHYLLNAFDVVVFDAVPTWVPCVISSVSISGLFQRDKLILMLVLKLQFINGHSAGVKMTLWEPGITTVGAVLENELGGIRPVIAKRV